MKNCIKYAVSLFESSDRCYADVALYFSAYVYTEILTIFIFNISLLYGYLIC